MPKVHIPGMCVLLGNFDTYCHVSSDRSLFQNTLPEGQLLSLSDLVSFSKVKTHTSSKSRLWILFIQISCYVWHQ
jgi:hypothetical protein